jgi:hypothetical protein
MIKTKTYFSYVCIFSVIFTSSASSAVSAMQFAANSSPTEEQGSESAEVSNLKLPMYEGASNKHVSVIVSSVTYAHKKDDYLPKDPNWAQVSLRVSNIGNAVISIDSVKSKQNSGNLLASAESVVQLAEPPDTMGEVAKSSGIAVAGHLAGMFIFPPLAILGGIGSVFGLSGGQKKWKKQMEKITASGLRTGMIPPDSSVEGNIYIPASIDQQALVVLYTVSGNAKTLTIPVSGHEEIVLDTKKKKKVLGVF